MHAEFKRCFEEKMVMLLDLNMANEGKKKAEERAKMFEEEKMKLELDMAEFIDGQKKKEHEDRLKMKKIKQYARGKENSLHYALAAVVILLGVVIALKSLSRCK